MPRRVRLLVPCLLLLAGCGDITYQTRYIPRTSELSWNHEYQQLPWRPPGLGADHYERTGRPAKPMYPAEIPVDVDWGARGYHYAGDGDAADSGAMEPLDLDDG